MNNLISKSLITLAGVSILTQPLLSSKPSLAMVTRDTAIITNSGSTNTIGYRIYVSPSGQASYVDGKGQHQGIISAKLVKNFFQDLAADMPLSNLQTKKSCVKSASFSTSTFVMLGGDRSPDLTCAGDAKARKLLHDVNAIAKALKVKNIPRSQGHDLPPQNF